MSVRQTAEPEYGNWVSAKLIYGSIAMIRSWGIREVAFADTSDSEFILKALRLPFMLGRIGIIYGKK
jgi:hypothetical protein